MVEVKISVKKTVDLILSEEEALWLKDLTQNPIMCNGFSCEDDDVFEIRHSIFEALKKSGI